MGLFYWSVVLIKLVYLTQKFYEDYDKMDIVMLQHELLEHNLMSEQDAPYRVAHEQANEQYNYQSFCDELDGKAGLR